MWRIVLAHLLVIRSSDLGIQVVTLDFRVSVYRNETRAIISEKQVALEFEPKEPQSGQSGQCLARSVRRESSTKSCILHVPYALPVLAVNGVNCLGEVERFGSKRFPAFTHPLVVTCQTWGKGTALHVLVHSYSPPFGASSTPVAPPAGLMIMRRTRHRPRATLLAPSDPRQVQTIGF